MNQTTNITANGTVSHFYVSPGCSKVSWDVGIVMVSIAAIATLVYHSFSCCKPLAPERVIQLSDTPQPVTVVVESPSPVSQPGEGSAPSPEDPAVERFKTRRIVATAVTIAVLYVIGSIGSLARIMSKCTIIPLKQ